MEPSEPPPIKPTDALWEWLTGRRSFGSFAANYPLLSLFSPKLINYLREAFRKPDSLAAHLTWVATLGLAVFAFMAWRDAKETTKNLTEQVTILKAQQRPWLDIVSAGSDERNPPNLCWDVKRKTATLSVALTVKNIGLSPAYALPYKITANRFLFGNCSTTKQKAEETTLFPQQTTIILSELEANYTMEDQPGAQFLQFMPFETCVYYRTPQDNDLHYTLAGIMVKADLSEMTRPGDLCLAVEASVGVKTAN